MNIHHVYDLPSFDGSDGLLAIVCTDTAATDLNKVNALTPPESSQQVLVMRRDKDSPVLPHAHKTVRRPAPDRTVEVLVILEGACEAAFFNSADDYVYSHRLHKGDVVVLLAGGHAIDFITETLIIEIKTGPYKGKEEDKRDLKR